MITFNIYIGWDSREPIAAEVCVHSILRHLPKINPVNIYFLKQNELRVAGIYQRAPDPGASTEFSLTRFLVPYLSGYKAGFSIFMDSDMLLTTDISRVFDHTNISLANPEGLPALWCVQHPEYTPKTNIKMDGKANPPYPRKNWSSFMVFNTGHPKLRKLTPEYITNALPRTLHRFEFLEDKDIGNLPVTWNYLVGEYPDEPGFVPNNLHYTTGIPEPGFDNRIESDYDSLWLEEKQRIQQNG